MGRGKKDEIVLRLFRLDTLLRNGGAPLMDLAEELEVNFRTVRRDIKHLQELGSNVAYANEKWSSTRAAFRSVEEKAQQDAHTSE